MRLPFEILLGRHPVRCVNSSSPHLSPPVSSPNFSFFFFAITLHHHHHQTPIQTHILITHKLSPPPHHRPFLVKIVFLPPSSPYYSFCHLHSTILFIVRAFVSNLVVDRICTSQKNHFLSASRPVRPIYTPHTYILSNLLFSLKSIIFSNTAGSY
jgi:hypothetical protein